jgi:hypothetical protein
MESEQIEFISLKEIKSIKGLEGFIVPKKLNDESYFIGLKENNIISSFIYYTCYPKYININYCFTLPNYRKRGKSTLLIEFLIKNNYKNIIALPLEGSNTNSIFKKKNFIKGQGDSVILYIT